MNKKKMQNKVLASNQQSLLFVCIFICVCDFVSFDSVKCRYNSAWQKYYACEFLYLPSDVPKAHFMILMVIVQGDNNNKIKINHGHVL
jgi:hypothetical protein